MGATGYAADWWIVFEYRYGLDGRGPCSGDGEACDHAADDDGAAQVVGLSRHRPVLSWRVVAPGT